MAAGSVEDAAPDPRERSPARSRAWRGSTRITASTIRSTSTQRARLASSDDAIPVGILYRNPEVPCYEELRGAGEPRTPERTRAGLEAEFDKVTIWPEDGAAQTRRVSPPTDSRRERIAMDMAAKFQEQLVFHMTGKRAGDGLAPVDSARCARRCSPATAIFRVCATTFRWCCRRRRGADVRAFAVGASSTRCSPICAPRGLEGERMRKHVLRLEREIRVMVAAGARAMLSELWASAAQKLGPDADETVGKVLAQAGDALKAGRRGGRLRRRAARTLRHAGVAARAGAQRAQEFRALVDSLMRKLSDILRAAFMHSAAGQQPKALAASIGSGHADVFDFAVMSKLVRAQRARRTSCRRRAAQRIEWALEVLRTQPFYADPDGAAPAEPSNSSSTTARLPPRRTATRLPRVAEVVKAMAIAELEADGAYVEADHDAFFERYDENSLTADDLALFPDYLVCIPRGSQRRAGEAGLIEMLSAGLPVKVLVQQTELLEEASIGTGHFAFGVRSARLATTAMGLGGMFVLQATSADLYALRERVATRARRARAGAVQHLRRLARRRRRPAAVPDRGGREGIAGVSRVHVRRCRRRQLGDALLARPQPQSRRRLAAVEPFEYADEAMQRVVEEVAFTYVDFVLCDRRYAAHFAVVPRERWNDGMLPVAEWLRLPERPATERIPYLWAVDADDRLHRVIVDARLMQAARRCLLLWHRLQEHARHSRFARRAAPGDESAPRGKPNGLRRRRRCRRLRPGARSRCARPAAAHPRPRPRSTEPAADAPPSDEPWIETSRCPSCNECQTINDKMFTYNDNKQAYIKDLDAGTFRQLVEAAEACQVAIIHPGKPRNPNEPGLEELIERAEPFR